MTPKPNDNPYIHIERDSLDIHGGEGSLSFDLLLKAVIPAGGDSSVEQIIGDVPELIDKLKARDLRDFNSTHAICIDAKVASGVGQGHREQAIYDALDPLTRYGWQDVLDCLGEDHSETGECYLEVVFGDPTSPGLITGLHHLEAASVTPVVESETSEDLHYRVSGSRGDANTVVMAQWGDLAALRERHNITLQSQDPNTAPRRDVTVLQGEIRNSEIIAVRQATNKCKHRGYPDYMSAVPSVELVQCMTQHEFDFYYNRGVPEFLLFLIGKNVGTAWDKITAMFKKNQGPGNAHKTNAVHIPGSAQETTVQVEKLAMEDAANSGFAEKSDTLDMRIATAHGMPPQLANIALPGKIGGANEGPNAMLTFQKRKLGRIQKSFSRAFARCLAGPGISFSSLEGGSKTLTRDQFLGTAFKRFEDDGNPLYIEKGNGFVTILDGMTLGAMETLAEMREPITGSSRNPAEGKLGGQDDRKKGDPKGRK